jgi:hypothetical protein
MLDHCEDGHTIRSLSSQSSYCLHIITIIKSFWFSQHTRQPGNDGDIVLVEVQFKGHIFTGTIMCSCLLHSEFHSPYSKPLALWDLGFALQLPQAVLCGR